MIQVLIFSGLLFHASTHSFIDNKNKNICQAVKQNFYYNSILIEVGARSGYSIKDLIVKQERFKKSYRRYSCFAHFDYIHSSTGINKKVDML
jgi:hypothetical protein